MPNPSDSNDMVYYDDVDIIVASGKQYRISGDVLMNGAPSAQGLPPAASGEFVTTFDGNTSTLLTVQNFAYYIPFEVVRPVVFDQVTINVTTGAASSSVRVGIYADNGTLRNPGALLVDCGSQATDTTGGKFYNVTIALQPGRYWAMVVPQGGAPTVTASFSTPVRVSLPVSSMANVKGFTPVSGALPSTATPATNATGAAPCLLFRVA